MVNNLIYSAQSTGVDTVIVDGDIILEGGLFTRLDEKLEYQGIDRAARDLYRRIGWQAQDRWPLL